jgi:hypothetical protein
VSAGHISPQEGGFRVSTALELRMAPRPNWKGYLKLSLVSCPIALYPATSTSERISFRQINKKTGNRLRQQLVEAIPSINVTGDSLTPMSPPSPCSWGYSDRF